MDQDGYFIRRWLGVVAATLLPVVITAFISIPLNLGGHPGEARNVVESAQHMT